LPYLPLNSPRFGGEDLGEFSSSYLAFLGKTRNPKLETATVQPLRNPAQPQSEQRHLIPAGSVLLLLPQAVWKLSQGLKGFLVFGLWDDPRAFDSRLLFNPEEQRPKGIVNIPPMTDRYISTLVSLSFRR
jgi:hypothetical protein